MKAPYLGGIIGALLALWLFGPTCEAQAHHSAFRPKLYAGAGNEIPLTCPDVEHALIYLVKQNVEARLAMVAVNCAPGDPECVGEAWILGQTDTMISFLERWRAYHCREA